MALCDLILSSVPLPSTIVASGPLALFQIPQLCPSEPLLLTGEALPPDNTVVAYSLPLVFCSEDTNS